MKQFSLLENAQLVTLLKECSLGELGLNISGFHLGALPLVLDLVSKPVVVIAETDLLGMVNDHLGLSWNNNFGLFFPDSKENDRLSLDGFHDDNIKILNSSLSLFRAFPEKVRCLLTSTAVFHKKLLSHPSVEPLVVDNSLVFENMCSWLHGAGYERTSVVVSENTYTTRGGIVDVFPCGNGRPVRVNFLEDQVSLYFFDVDSQLTGPSAPTFSIAAINKETGLFSLAEKTGDDFLFVQIVDENSIFIGSQDCQNASFIFDYGVIDHREFVSLYKTKPNLSYVESSLFSVGFVDSSQNYIVPDWFVGRKVFDKKNPVPKKNFFDLSIIETGDYVVHQHHGIGKYLGVSFCENNGVKQEFVEIEYEEFSKVSVSIDRLDLLSFYASAHESGICLDSLARPGNWRKRRAQAKGSAEDFVEEIVMSYAARESTTKEPVVGDPELESLFIGDFPFQDTEDQETAWNEISKDLSSSSPMNRLLCGDVGFGKTEMAIRSAFRVVCSGKQVLVLAPTTVLASQLFASFSSRLNDFSVNVGMVSRFKTVSKRKEVLQNYSNGKVDVLIGTHSILFGDISFNNTGLLIVDEEHRFGVKQKEKIPSLIPSADFLTMSATPIPRTLHMAVSGIRSISALSTPPLARKPISTSVAYSDKKLIYKAIEYETNRGGQVFFVNNNIASIDFDVDRIQTMFPLLSVAKAHGQMCSKLLERTMASFLSGEIDVLVCSSIIETGLDIPNANTIIVSRAHLLGLSQLYQIRGRVGRSNRQAFAYLLVPPAIKLSKKAFKRLKTIEQNAALGSGYSVSMMDLEIRGAGSLFGYKQSGGAGRVGIELYSRFVKEALIKNFPQSQDNKERAIPVEDVSVSLFLENIIPDDYVSNETVRLSFYRKIAVAGNSKELDKIEYELENRFGAVPSSVKNLLFSALVKIGFSKAGVSGVAVKNTNLHVIFEEDKVLFDMVDFVKLVGDEPVKLYQKHWFKRTGSKSIELIIGNVNRKDISTIMSNILNKLSILKLNK
ncbi:MAG: DEAD/DEAH box helicase [Candidatus Marinimicrobia bacterium]|nr:DEAD/DEAH box helicase [Candidatus Neomarinimicrobiota bacterium]MBL7023318.1 DEAD/DEAH box helicase [Candidatus Neomarinimicrobiota bacterium]